MENSVDKTDWEFFEEYKRLDELCKQILLRDRGVSAYIDEMEKEYRGRMLVINWEKDYKQLKRMRWIRNQIAHEACSITENLVTVEDIKWIKNFYTRIMECTDPFSLLRKAKNKDLKMKVKSKPQIEQQYLDKEDINKSSGPDGGLKTAFLLAIIILLILFSIFGFTACKSKTDGIWPMAIKVDGQLYFCYDEIAETDDIEIRGYITSTLESNQGPKEDNQANFHAGLNQPYGMLGERMVVFYEDNWHICYLTVEDEEGARTIQPYRVSMEFVEMERVSRQAICLSWTGNYDDVVENYLVKRRETERGKGIGEWTVLATIPSDKILSNGDWYYTDELESTEPQQYEYRIDMEIIDTEDYIAEEGKVILGSNVKICIDPGHYDIAREVADADEYHYVEGNFVLELALELQKILKENFGIDSCLTRETGTITLGEYSDEELDGAHISLRGEYAANEDCDLFVSLHTNSNAEDANDYPTFFQPLEINKPIVIVNTVALTSDVAMEVANATGTKLASVNYELGLAESDMFCEVTANGVSEWTKDYNDGLGEMGTVVIRTGKKNPDYYGVLRGATNVGVPGMIIEHGYHSVAEVRKAAITGDLKEVWANADVVGIAYGFGFTK